MVRIKNIVNEIQTLSGNQKKIKSLPQCEIVPKGDFLLKNSLMLLLELRIRRLD